LAYSERRCKRDQRQESVLPPRSGSLQLLGELFVLFLDPIIAKVGMFGHVD